MGHIAHQHSPFQTKIAYLHFLIQIPSYSESHTTMVTFLAWMDRKTDGQKKQEKLTNIPGI